MTDYIREMQERYREMATENVEQRIARGLLRLAGQTGTTLYTVSRILSAGEKRRVIATGRERIILSNPHAVVCIAEGLETPAKK